MEYMGGIVLPFLSSAEKLFWDNAAENWRLAKARTRPRVRDIGGALKMTPNEVLAALKKMGVKVSRQTLTNYENDGLIPEPKRGGHGKGRGRYTDYPDETPAEFYASHKLRHNQSVRPELLARSRQKGLMMEHNRGMAFIDWIMGKDATPESMQEAGLGQQWLKEKHKVLHNDGKPCQICKTFERWEK